VEGGGEGLALSIPTFYFMAPPMHYTIQHDERGRQIEFRQMSISPGQTTANNCNTAFSLHVVESASDDYNF